jgi:hypothetical protein
MLLSIMLCKFTISLFRVNKEINVFVVFKFHVPEQNTKYPIITIIIYKMYIRSPIKKQQE